MTRSTMTPRAAEPGVGAPPERGGGAARLVGEDLGVGEAAVVVDGGVEVGVADALAASVPVLVAARPWILWPPPGGIVPSFLTSTWTSSPGRDRS